MSIKIICGDVRDVLPTLPTDSFDCIVTSPPYWGLRDYGCAGQIGLEPTLYGYLTTMTAIFRECRRVLKPEGTFWLNSGDSYAPSRRGGGGGSIQNDDFGKKVSLVNSRRSPALGFKSKDLCMVPNRLAIMLQDDGWYVRSEIIWHKPNPMPESVTDRPTRAHEKVWMLTKSERYFYDAAAISESAIKGAAGSSFTDGKTGTHQLGRASKNERFETTTRNARNVWTIATQPYTGAHFATMAPDLAERCIKAGSPYGGLVLDPFGGAGTSGLVADRIGRNATLIELNSAYAEIARNRIDGDSPLFAGADAHESLPLFGGAE